MLKLGKLPATEDRRDLRFAQFADLTALPGVPSRFGHGSIIRDWKMLGNGPDPTVAPGFRGAGDCVFAGGAHETMLWTKLGDPVTAKFTGKEVIADYSTVTGYVVGDDSTDQGTYVRDALVYRQKTGLLDAAGKRHKIGAYVALDPGSWDDLLVATYLFGAVGIGFEFPSSAWPQFDAGQTWTVTGDSEIEGGHYVSVVGRIKRPTGDEVGVITWGKRQGMRRDFYERYVDEAWVMISPEELRSGTNERGFDLAALKSALAQLRA